MMYAVLSLLIVVRISNGDTNGFHSHRKLVHDMRYFSTISYDWNFRSYDATGNLSLPVCHEWRIRCSYFDQPFPELAIAYARTDKGMRTGHLVYPLIVTVNNGNIPREASKKKYYAAAIHKVYSEEFILEADKNRSSSSTLGMFPNHIYVPVDTNKVLEIVIVSEATWRMLWATWVVLNEKGIQACEGGRYFDHILPFIYKDGKASPRYEDIIPEYTELTSDVCNLTFCDSRVHNDQETLTLAYPTEEGFAHPTELLSLFNLRLPFGNPTDKEAKHQRDSAVKRTRDFANTQFRSFIRNRSFDGYKRFPSMAANQCIFHQPYCYIGNMPNQKF